MYGIWSGLVIDVAPQLIYHLVQPENYSCCALRKLNISESHENFYNDALGHAEHESELIFIIAIIKNIKKNIYIEKNKRYRKYFHYSRYHHLIFIIIIIIIVFIHQYGDGGGGSGGGEGTSYNNLIDKNYNNGLYFLL